MEQWQKMELETWIGDGVDSHMLETVEAAEDIFLRWPRPDQDLSRFAVLAVTDELLASGAADNPAAARRVILELREQLARVGAGHDRRPLDGLQQAAHLLITGDESGWSKESFAEASGLQRETLHEWLQQRAQ